MMRNGSLQLHGVVNIKVEVEENQQFVGGGSYSLTNIFVTDLDGGRFTLSLFCDNPTMKVDMDPAQPMRQDQVNDCLVCGGECTNPLA